MAVEPTDERSHPAGAELRWAESWTFDFATPDAGLGGWARITVLPNQPRSWYDAFLCGPDRDLVAVIDHEVPTPDRSLEIRTDGLWATHICETPLDHWTIGLEAFALGVDDPAEIYGRQLGERVPLGFDLEWESEAPAGASGAHDAYDAYDQACRVSGEILVGRAEIDFDGYGRRGHRWGPLPDWDQRWFRAHGRLDDGTTFTVGVVGGDLAAATGTVAEHPVPVEQVHQRMDGPGLPGTSGATLGGLRLDLDPVAVTPLELVDPEGRRTRAPRALCAVSAADGRGGAAWAEWNEPRR